MVEVSLLSVEFIYCGCGCKKTRPRYNKDGSVGKYIYQHNIKNQKHTEETKKKIRESCKGINLAENNGMWVGNRVQRRQLHRWVRKRKPIAKFCEFCNKVEPKHLANITGVYNRELENWKYLCYVCHNRYDQRVKMNETRTRKCLICGSDKTYVDKKTGWIQWRKHKDGYICIRCYTRYGSNK